MAIFGITPIWFVAMAAEQQVQDLIEAAAKMRDYLHVRGRRDQAISDDPDLARRVEAIEDALRPFGR